MIDWPETRLQIQLWLHQSWPFRVLAWVRMRGVPETQGFGRFQDGSEPPDEVGSRLRAKISQREPQEAAVSSEAAIAREAGAIPKLREARPESVSELLDELERFAALQKFHPGPYELRINLFGQPCSQKDADAVINADDPLQAARDLMTRKLNGMEHK